MSKKWDGLSAAYLTGSYGQSFAMLVFQEGIIAGAYPLGVIFDGV